MFRKNFIEFLGTFFLVLTVALSGNPFAIGAVLAVLVYMGGYISGANYNPAVTLGLLVTNNLKAKEAIQYMVSQMLGGILAVLIANFITQSKFLPSIGNGYGMSEALLVEVIFTFLLVFVVLNVAATKKVEGNGYYGLAIGLALLVGAVAGGSISGGAYNPAVGISPFIASISDFGDSLSLIALYFVGPLSGGFLAGMVYKILEDKKSK